MSVRAKFVFTRYETSLHTSYDPVTKKNGSPEELRTLYFTPVYGNGDPNHENTKFFKWSPSGEIKLGTVNRAAWEHMKLGAEYYVDFTMATSPPEVKPAD